MNKDEILHSKPGRDLDIKVAVTVMDYIWLKHLLQFSAELAVKWLGTSADLKESCGMYTLVPDSQFVALKERENHAEAVLNFSTQMGPASQVIDKMQEIGYEYHLETKMVQDRPSYYASFYKLGAMNDENLLGFTNQPEAIVKAALVALL